MKHETLILILVLFSALVTGCQEPAGGKAVWEGVKITDLADEAGGGEVAERELKAINLKIFVIDIPADRTEVVLSVAEELSSKQLKMGNFKTFVANSFVAGMGHMDMWDEIAEQLRQAGGGVTETISLMIGAGIDQDVEITSLMEEKRIFYVSSDSSAASETIGPGKIVLRLRVENIPGARGVSKVSFMPAFTLFSKSSIPSIAEYERRKEVLFEGLGFEARMGPGDFLFLGPKKHYEGQSTLNGLFFSREKLFKLSRVYMFICTNVVD